MSQKQGRILAIILALIGLISSSVGLYLQYDKPVINPNTEKQEQEKEDNPDIPLDQPLTITLKTLQIKVQENLPETITDYIVEEVNPDILKVLVLDTSKVDITKAGTYEYSITYHDDIFTGTITIIEEEPVVQEIKFTIKNITVKNTEELSKNVKDYIEGDLSIDVLNQMMLDLSSVIQKQIGSYQYKITYLDKIYVGTITIIEDQTKPITPSEEENQEEPNKEPDPTEKQDTQEKETTMPE